MKISYFILLISLIAISCEKSSYSEEEEAQLKDALKLYNESMAIFSQTTGLLAQVTEAKRELVRKTGIAMPDSAGNMVASDTSRSAGSTGTGQTEAQEQNNKNERDSDPSSGTGEQANVTQDTTVTRNATEAMNKLNTVQADLMKWMRNVYKVPGVNVGEKSAASPSIGGDQDSRMLLTDMQYQEFPEDASTEMVYEVQKDMNEEIIRIQKEMKEAIENARTIYFNAN